MSLPPRKRRYSQITGDPLENYTKRARDLSGASFVPRLLPVSDPRVQQLMAARRRMVGPGPEVKSVDIVNPNLSNVLGNFSLNTTVVLTPLNTLFPGSARWQRIGRKINLKSLEITGHLVPIASVAFPSWARIMVVYDKQPNGALPTIDDILLSQVTAATDSNVSTVLSMINLNNRERFEIIRDMKFKVGPTNSANYPDCYDGGKAITSYIPLGNRETVYKADAGSIGDIATGSLLFITFGNQASGAAPFVFQGTLRLRYLDV